MAEVKTYSRAMPATWWLRKPFYLFYMVREGTALFFFLYALVLLWGLAALSQGEAAYDGWRAVLASPPMIAFHVVAAALALLHTVTWFMVLPKTAPTLRIGSTVIPDRAVLAVGLAVTAGLSAFVYAWVAGTLPPALADIVRSIPGLPGGAS